MANELFCCSHRVTYADCSVGNHVYYARYLDLLEAARGEFFRHLGTTFLQWQQSGVVFPVIECQLRYKAPARYDDLLQMEIWLSQLERVRLSFAYRILNQHRTLILEGTTGHVCASTEEKPRRLPGEPDGEPPTLPASTAAMNVLPNRREFLEASWRGLVGAGALGLLSSCATTRQGNGSRGIELTDTHVHFYDPARPQGVPWPPKDDAVLYRTVLPKDYAAQPKPQPVAGVIVVEASPWVEDNQWVLELAAREPIIRGLVGQLPVGTPEFEGHLQRFSKNPLFRGLRVRPAPSRERWLAPDYLADLRRLAEHDLSLDLVGGMEVLEWAPAIARTLPDLRLIVDHLAGVRIDGKAPAADWLQAMRGLVAHKNVFIKVSGLIEGTDRRAGQAPHAVEFYQPTLEALWTTFGEDRLLYGSNWPVCELFSDLATVQRIPAEYFSAKGARVAGKVLSSNSQRAYRWIDREN